MIKRIILSSVALLLSLFAIGQQENDFIYEGSGQTWVVPSCVTTITIEAAGGQGGGNTTYGEKGGDGAIVKQTVSVISGHTLEVFVGGCGNCIAVTNDNNGGGGGTFIWDIQSDKYPILVAGGGGGAGNAGIGGPGSTTLFGTTDPDGESGTGAVLGDSGVQGTATVAGSGGGGGGWNTLGTINPTFNNGGEGSGFPGGCAGGAGRLDNNTTITSTGSPGGGGGGGLYSNAASRYGGGGGGGGYTGGGGGNAVSITDWYGGGGGGSGYYKGAYPYTTTSLFVGPTSVTQTNGGSTTVNKPGYVDITWFNYATTAFVVTEAIACANDGSASVTVVGGASPFTYLWSPGGQTTQTAVNLSAGTYTVNVTDHNGCVASNTDASVTITKPAALTASAVINADASACANIGKATVTPGGGVTPYTYSWSPSGKTTAIASNLSAGSYTVTVKDNDGCTATATVSITAPAAAVSASAVVNSNASACTNDGKATVTPGGGNTPYTYSWSPSGKTTAIASDLSAGSYTVTVTDNDGCSHTASITITSPLVAVTVSAVVNNNSSGCANDGKATATPAGGTTPYTYSWNDGSSQATAIATGLSAGSYTVTLTDKNGCSATASISITSPVTMTTTALVNNNASACANNGKATASPSGGNTPYTYSWNDPSSQTTITASGLSARSYTVTVHDNNGCVATASVSITVPTALTTGATLNNNATTACSNDGSATATPSGGITPYTYTWTGGNTNANATGLSVGSYTVTVKDIDGCSATASIAIAGPSPVTAGVTINNNSSACAHTGNATINPGGGTTPYTYSWTGGNTNANVTNLSAGSYTVTVKDKNGCSATASVGITAPGAVTASAIVNNASAACVNTGKATVTPGGGNTPYTYSWVPSGKTTAVASDLSVGSYTVTVKDNDGCSATAHVSITAPASSLATGAVVNNNSSGCGNNGSATASPSAGTTPYTYSWTGGNTNANASGLSVGSYTVSVVDNGGCSASASITITGPAPVTASASLNNNATACVNNGSATVTPGGGNTPYTYLWNDLSGQTTAIATGLSAGSYIVTVMDVDGCSATSNISIMAPAPVTASSSIIQNTTECTSLGVAAVIPGGGTTPYTYSWTGGTTNSVAVGLSAGGYTVTITDMSGCTATASINITAPAAVTANGSVIQNTAECTNIGIASVTAGGGISPYAYSWTGGSTNSNATGLSAGNYTVTVSDQNGCAATASVGITAPAAVTANGNVIQNTTECTSNGIASVIAGGGALPYTYSWTGGNTNVTATGLSAGSYTITVNDNKGCSATASVTITAPTVVTASALVNNNTTACANTGAITVTPGGGITPYTYSWTGGSTNDNATGLSAGGYTVIVTDNNGCTATSSAAITGAPLITASGTVINNTTECSNTGIASIIPSGGTTPYTYSWSGGYTNSYATGLSAGSYSITVTDVNNCSATTSITITAPATLTASALVNNNSSVCTSNGSATVTPGGGNSPYTYLWNDAGSQAAATASTLGAGSYTVTVNDINGCTATASITITAPTSPVTASITIISNASSCANDGKATAVPGGGLVPYTYTWTGGNTNANATGLSAGNYIVTVKDNNGCSATASTTITAPASPISASATVNTNASACASSGSATATPGGGSLPYTYSWNDASSQATAKAVGLSAGSYIVTVNDNNGCSATASITITAPIAAVTASGSIISNTTECSSIGIASVIPAGGNTPYTYSWTGGSSSSVALGLSVGGYTVTVTDNNGCIAIASVSITAPSAVTAGGSVTQNTTECASLGSAFIVPGGGTGVYVYSWPGGNTNINATGLSAGVYNIKVTDDNGCSATADISITAPSAVSAIGLVNSNATTACANNGSATVIPGGGITAYTYSWTGGVSNSNISSLSAGVYTVSVTDANGCLATTSVIITAPTAVTASAVINNNSLGCASTGKATVTPDGGITPYTYLWNDASSQTTPIASGLAVGSYTVIVKDNNDCSATAGITITAPVITVTASSSIIHNTTECSNVGIASIIPGGGLSPYTYSWTGGYNGSFATGLSAGGYTVTVTDANNCSATVGVSITAPTAIIAPAVVISNSSACTDNGIVSVTPSGGLSPYTYSWAGGSINSNVTGLSAGIYTVTVTDYNGCSVTSSATITAPPSLVTASAAVNSNSSACAYNGVATVTPGGGVLPYTYSWTGSNTNSTATGLSAGGYTVTIHDNNGCSATSSVIITTPAPVTASAVVTSNSAACTYNGIGTVTPGGGTLPYTYFWTGGNSNAVATGLSAGGYTVTITDNNNCSATSSITITTPASLFTANPAVINNSSACGNIGSAVVTPGGGIGPYTYSWTNSSTTSSAIGLSAGDYIVTIIDGNGCTATASIAITAPPVVTANATVSDNVTSCIVDNGSTAVTAAGGTLPYTYSWTGGNTNTNATGLSAGGYTVTVTDNYGCSGTASALVTAPTPVNASLTANKNPICAGTLDNLTATPISGTFPFAFLWNNGRTTDTINVNPLTSATYTITVTDANGCVGTISLAINVNPVPAINPGQNSSICLGDGTTIGSSFVFGSRYIWSPVAGLNVDTVPQPIASPTITTTYTLKVSNGLCSDTSSVRVTVFPLPEAYTGPDQTIYGVASITIGSNNPITGHTYKWTPSSGLNSTTISDPTTTPPVTTTYTLTETDTTTGCSMSNTVVITVDDGIIYNAFSPNGDGVNDWWDIPLLYAYPENLVIIENRWGSEVWRGSNYDNKNVRWTGENMSGADLPDGMYYYIISYGNVTLRGWVMVKR